MLRLQCWDCSVKIVVLGAGEIIHSLCRKRARKNRRAAEETGHIGEVRGTRGYSGPSEQTGRGKR